MQMSNISAQVVDQTLEPNVTDLGEFSVRRLLPSATRRMVGPFIFFDHMGPAEFPPGKGIAVRPHPHIGIATITYLFEGEIMHRDSLGYTQAIRPGAVNLMTAGRGIVHSERAGEDLDRHSRLHGIQSWIALPDSEQEREPAFTHFPAADLPVIEREGVHIRLIMGEAFGQKSPVTRYSRTLYADCLLQAGAVIEFPNEEREQALYVAEGEVSIEGRSFVGGQMVLLRPGRPLAVRSGIDSRLMLIGGDPLGRRHISWNFVHSSKERIARAGEDWRAGRFPHVPGDDEFIPLPE
jgi:hypothetical protein